jgi:DNA-binding GntR family transcriptional regulator
MNPRFKELVEKNPSESSLKLVYKYLYREIISLSMSPGAKINHTKIAHDLDVSRTTVRDAVLMLLNANLVEPLPNQGFRVSHLKVKEMGELYATRKIIESGAAKILCEKISKDQIQKLHLLIKDMELSLTEKDYEAFAYLDSAFHRSIVEFCSIPYLVSMYQSIADIISRYIAFTAYINNPTNITPQTPLMLRQHSMILTSLELGMTENVANIIEKHFVDAEKSLLHPYFHLSS